MASHTISLIISSPSGAGKTTITRRLLERDSRLALSVSATTRPPRTGEVNGSDYFFISHDDYQHYCETGEFFEHVSLFGNGYGTLRHQVAQLVAQGKDVLFDIDWQGAQQLRLSLAPPVISVFIVPPSMAELDRRLRARRLDSEESIAKRLALARQEISHWQEYDYVLVNDQVDSCIRDIEAIIQAARTHQPLSLPIPEIVHSL